MERHREKQKHSELLAGIVAAAVRNFSYHLPDNPVAPVVFMPKYDNERQPETRKRLNRKKIAEDVRAAFRNHARVVRAS